MQNVAASESPGPVVPLNGAKAAPPACSGRARGHDRSAPDLTPLSRGVASRLESLLIYAQRALVREVEAVKLGLKLVLTNSASKSWQDAHRIELLAIEGMLDDARRYEKAARRRRMAKLNGAERESLLAARDADPEVGGAALDAILMQEAIDPLDRAGAELDAAMAALDEAPVQEAEFAAAEARYFAAQQSYVALLTAHTGQSADEIARRLR